jgi:hypothetical protein
LLSLLSLPKITTEEFAVIGSFCGELYLSGVRKTGERQLAISPKTGKLQLHIWE